MSSNPFALSSDRVSVNLGYVQVLPPPESPDATELERVTFVLPTQLPGELGDMVERVEWRRPDDFDSPVLMVCFARVAFYLAFAAMETLTHGLLERAAVEGVRVVMFQPGTEDCYTFAVEAAVLRDALVSAEGKSWELEAWLGNATEFVRQLPCGEKKHCVFFMMPKPYFVQP